MIPALRRERSFPVLLPGDLAARPRPRRRRQPMAAALAVAALVVVPPIAYVAQQNRIAQTGYRILTLRSEIARLERDGDRLEARVAALRSPARIERVAARELGLRAPERLASLRVAGTAPQQTAARSEWWAHLREWFVRGEAQASEARP